MAMSNQKWRKTIATAARRLALSACIIFPLGASAQGFPNKPLTFNYPFSAGSAADSAWRIITAEAGKRLGQQIVFMNKPGGNGRLAVNAVTAAAPDGYTLGLATNGLALSLSMAPSPRRLDLATQTRPVILGIETPLIIAASPGVPYRDFAGFIAYAKAHPGSVNIASAGVGTGSHIGIAVLANRAGIDVTHVPYKGSGPALQALLAGEIDVDFSDPSVQPYVESGKALALAVTSERRWSEMPDVATVREQGVADASFSTYMYVLTSAGVPADIVEKLNHAFQQALDTPEVKEKLLKAGWIINGGTAAHASELLAKELERLRPVVSAAGITFE